MATVLVAARCNLDRVWHLASPLRPGGRVSFTGETERYGGGGTYTGSALAALGHDVRLVGPLADDDRGRRYRADLIAHGFDPSALTPVHGPTIPTEVLLDPAGERTILAAAGVEHAPVETLDLAGVDLLYVNARRVVPGLLAAAMARCPVIAQVPLQPGELRPCHWLVGSMSDLEPMLSGDPFAFGRRFAGDSLEALIVTAGPGPVRIWTADGHWSEAPPILDHIPDSSGAGDVFAGALADTRLRGLPVRQAVAAASAHAVRFLANRTTLPLPG